jgi:hypothetical protein
MMSKAGLAANRGDLYRKSGGAALIHKARGRASTYHLAPASWNIRARAGSTEMAEFLIEGGSFLQPIMLRWVLVAVEV